MLSKKNALLFFLVCLLPLLSISQQGFQDVVFESVDDLCFGNQSETADQEAESIVDEMMGQMGLKRIFKMRKCEKINNAHAHIEEDENNNLVPYILYDPAWLSQMSKKSNTDWASIGVLAHEVGHFLLYHSLNKRGSNPRWELSADRFAGYTLAKMGSTLEEAQSMFQNVSEKGSSTHPGRAERMEAIKIGWMKFNNPTERKIILNENTPERDITEDLIINRYYKELGGLKRISELKELNFKETITETIGQNIKQKPVEYSLDYNQSVNETKILFESRGEQEQYLIKNDSLFHKYIDEKNWNSGAPGIGTSLKQEDYSFKKEIRPSTENFFRDFLLVSNPDVADYLGKKRLNDEVCFVLELPEKIVILGDLNKKGKRVSSITEYYFSAYSGLLYGVVETEKITEFKKGKPKEQKTIEFERVISKFNEIDGIQFPAIVQTKETEFEGGVISKDDAIIYQERKFSEVQLNQ